MAEFGRWRAGHWEMHRGYAPAMARLVLSQMMRFQRHWIAAGGREVEEGISMARQAIAAGGDDPLVLDFAGLTLSVLAGDNDAALSALDHAIVLNPNFALAFGHRALVLASTMPCSGRSCPAASSPHRKPEAQLLQPLGRLQHPARRGVPAHHPRQAGGRSTSSPASAAPSSPRCAGRRFNFGFGYRVFFNDHFAVQLDLRDHIFSLDLLGRRREHAERRGHRRPVLLLLRVGFGTPMILLRPVPFAAAYDSPAGTAMLCVARGHPAAIAPRPPRPTSRCAAPTAATCAWTNSAARS